MKRKFTAGTTSLMEAIRVYDSSSTTGGYLSGLTFASSGLTGKYRREGDSAWTAITIVTATAGTFTSGGFAVPTSGPTGSYELHIPNAAIASGKSWVEIEFYGVANMVPVRLFYELDVLAYQTAAGGAVMPTTAGRTLDVSAGGEAGVDWANIGSPTTTNALTGTTVAPTQKVDVDTIKTNPVVNAGTITFPTTATLASTTNITGGTIANLTNAPTAGDLTAAMKASVTAAVPTTAQIEAAILNEGDATALLAAIATAVRTNLATELARIDAAISSRSTYAGGDTSGTTTLLSRVVGTIATGTHNPQSGDAYARIGAAGVGLTSVAIVSGGITSGSFAAGAINAAAIATDAIDADALAADAITEIWSKAMTELTAVPGVTASVLQALTWVFELSRNKVTQTATTQIVKKDDGSTTLGASTVSDDGTTFTRGVFN